MTKGILFSGLEQLEPRQLLSTSAPAYLVPSAPGVQITPLITVGEAAPNGYRMVGIPDGLGAFDNGDGTFTVLMNHELRPTVGVVRAHGSKGAFVSRWVIDKKTGEVLSGQDQVKTVFLFDPLTGSYVNATHAFNRLCSADLADQTAYFNPASGKGTRERIFTDGEEASDGRAFAHIVSSGQSYELPGLGKLAFENVLASPYPQDLTIVAGVDDSSRLFSSEGDPLPSEVYFYIGQKKSSGSVVERAGLTGGILHGLKVGRGAHSAANETEIQSGDRFHLASLGDVSGMSAAQLQTASIEERITQFRRSEDGAWDPNNPNVFYFVTTDIFGGNTRLWKLTFDDITRPEKGGRIEIVENSPAGVPGEMFDNIDVNYNSDVLINEDPGGQDYLARIWQHDASSGELIEVAKHNPAVFDPNFLGTGMSGPNFITRDEESSGIIDISEIMGEGWYLTDVQAHAANPDPELVEFGQLLLINTNAAKAKLQRRVLEVTGTINDDEIVVSRDGNRLVVSFNGASIGSFNRNAVDSIEISTFAGDDDVIVQGIPQSQVTIDLGSGEDEEENDVLA